MTSSDERAAALAGKLESLTETAIDALGEVLRLRVDAENGPALRAIVAAANGAMNAQLRADAMRLRALRQDAALAALLAIIAAKEGAIPCEKPAARVVDAASVSADVVPFLG